MPGRTLETASESAQLSQLLVETRDGRCSRPGLSWAGIKEGSEVAPAAPGRKTYAPPTAQTQRNPEDHGVGLRSVY